MTNKKYFDRNISNITALGRSELTRRIRNFKGKFRLDFTEDYLNNISVDRLRHILLAALINAKPGNDYSKILDEKKYQTPDIE